MNMKRLSSGVALLFRRVQHPSERGVALIGTEGSQNTAPLRSLVVAVAFANALIPTMSFAARAEDGNCFGFGSLAENSEVSLGRVNADAPRTYFVRNRADAGECPNASAKCRAKSYFVPGDRVILSRTNGAFVCVNFTDTKGVPRPTWLPASAVDREVSSSPAFADWVGEWTEVESKIELRPSGKAGALSISGEATWGSLDPERVKSGGVHIGSIEGVAAPVGGVLSFAMGENDVTLPVDKGKDGDCKVWMRRLGPYLLVSDNNNCGGMNVSFWGVYKRKGAAAINTVATGAPQPQAEETFTIHGQTFRLVPCSKQEGTAPASWKDVKADLPSGELAKGNMTEPDAKAALKKMTEAMNVNINKEIFSLYPAHRPISATDKEWSNIGEAEEKLGDIFYGNKAVKELGPWAAAMQKEFRVATALNCINQVLNPILPTPSPRQN
jgi:hypothetical protein